MTLRPRFPRSPKALELPVKRTLYKRRYALEEALVADKAVFLAWDAHLDRQVLMKQATSKQQRDRLLREASLLERLCHPFIPALLDTFDDPDGTFCLVEELRPGVTMSQQHWFSLAEVVEIGTRLCECLGYLHERDVIHRDIKPENILIRPFSLIDFDFAAELRDPWRKGGSAGYVAPEQFSQGVIHPQADIYSMGMVLGCALADCQPEDVRTRPFSGLWDDPLAIPDEIRLLLDVLDRAIAQRPVERPTLAELQHILGQVALF